MTDSLLNIFILAQAAGLYSKEVVLGGGGIILAAFGVVWKMFTDIRRKVDEKAETNETRLRERDAHLLTLTGEVGELKGQVKMANQVTEKIDDIHAGVLDLVTESKNKSTDSSNDS